MSLTRAENATSTLARPQVSGAGALVCSRCTACDRKSWPARAVCSACGSDRVELEELPRQGQLRSYTTVWVPRANLPTPYTLGDIDLGQGATLFAHVRALPDGATVPTEVHIVLAPNLDQVPRFWFEPVASRAEPGTVPRSEIRLGVARRAMVDRLLSGDIGALSRGISLVERGSGAAAKLVAQASPHVGHAKITGVTGPPGVGKSKLIGAMINRLRARGERVALLAVDPSSPFTRGALLGDRIRLSEHFLDDGVFIRSMASRGALGGLAEAVFSAVLLLDAAGFDQVIVETVGVGQAEIDIVDLVDTVVLVLMPGAGDAVQAMKAGVMEIPDVIVVNKADQPGTDQTARQLRQTKRSTSRSSWNVPILTTNALTGAGADELLDAVAAHRAYLRGEGRGEARRRSSLARQVTRLALGLMHDRLVHELHETGAGLALLEEVAARRLDPATAAQRLLDAPPSVADHA